MAPSTALLPWTDRYHWLTNTLKDIDSCVWYFDACERRLHLPTHCKSLRVALGPDTEELFGSWLEYVLPRMINLQHLALSDLPGPLFERLLETPRSGIDKAEGRETASLLPPNLCTLSLTCTAGTRQDPYHPSWWQGPLARLDKLNSLSLDLRISANTPGKLPTREAYSFAQVEHLSVGLPPPTDSSSVDLLIASCPNLRGLELESKATRSPFTTALASLAVPSALDSLTLIGRPRRRPYLPPEFDLLTSLHRLKLTDQWQVLSDGDIERLCALPLRHFALSDQTDFRLAPFVDCLDRGGLPYLESLRFDNVSPPKAHEHDDRCFDAQTQQICCREREEQYAHWTKAFDEINARVLLDICQGRRVRLDGGMVDVLWHTDSESEQWEDQSEKEDELSRLMRSSRRYYR